MLWAPLRWLQKPALALLVGVILAGVITLTVLYTSTVAGFVLGWAIIGYVGFGVRVAGQVLYQLNNDEGNELKWKWLERQSMTLKGLACILALPILLIVATFLLIVCSVVYMFVGLHEDYDIYRRFGRWQKKWIFEQKMTNRRPFSWIRIWLLGPLTLALLSWPYMVARVIFLTLVGLALLAGLIVAAAITVETVREQANTRRLQAVEMLRRARTSAMMHDMFTIMHPEGASDLAAYQKWFTRYNEYCKRKWGSDVYNVDNYDHLQYISRRYYRLLESRGTRADDPSLYLPGRRLNAVSRAASAAADFLVLLWSFILTRKWKVCPLVDLPH